MRGLGVALILAAALLAAGCGTGGPATAGDVSRGKDLFNQKCASCHILADARSKGTIGPNLDDAFVSARKQGFKESTIRDAVLDQIRFAIPPMPKNLVQGDDASAVASYVAGVAGKPVAGGAQTGPQGGGGATDGKSIFASAGCGSCHTLKDAGTSATIGPDLDKAKLSKELVVTRVTSGKGVMPPFKGQLSDPQIQAVAEYVSSVAGK